MTKYIESLTIKVRSAENKFKAAKMAWDKVGSKERMTRVAVINGAIVYGVDEDLRDAESELWELTQRLAKAKEHANATQNAELRELEFVLYSTPEKNGYASPKDSLPKPHSAYQNVLAAKAAAQFFGLDNYQVRPNNHVLACVTSSSYNENEGIIVKNNK